jgi:peptidase E
MEQSDTEIRGRILAIGKGANTTLIRKFRDLTGKASPRICYLPTASGDHPDLIAWWKTLGQEIGFDAHVQKMFISTFDQSESFAEVLLSMDAIYVGGGNTVNMLAVWEVQGIIDILRQALAQDILLGGGSAGGICWFEGGLTDSRPKILTPMTALGWLKGSFAPHYLSEPGRREYFHQYIQEDALTDGYGCDEPVGLYFEDGERVKAVGSTSDAQAFFVRKTADGIVETSISVEMV